MSQKSQGQKSIAAGVERIKWVLQDAFARSYGWTMRISKTQLVNQYPSDTDATRLNATQFH